MIGAATAYEMAKSGWKTINVDRNGQAGYGSTSGSCAIIRVHYSTLDGTAFAYEGYFYWRDWAEYLEASDADGLAQFRQTGCLVMKTDGNNNLQKHIDICRELAIPFEEWDADQVRQALPIYALDRYFPAKRLDDPDFGKPTGGALIGGVYWPTAGYVTDPALSAQNLADAAARHGGRFRYNATVTEILRDGGKVAGVKLSDGY